MAGQPNPPNVPTQKQGLIKGYCIISPWILKSIVDTSEELPITSFKLFKSIPASPS